jgi:L-lactate transport
MWQQNYLAVGGNLWLSAAVAALPIFLLFYLIGLRRLAAWKAALAALATGLVIACAAFGAPVSVAVASALYGAAFGMFPIFWIVLSAIFLYRLTVESGQFEVIKDSIAHLTDDKRLHVLLIAFAFGSFVEGAAGFGAPVAIAGAMLAGVGVSAFDAAALCLLANTAPVAFGSIGIPVITLAKITGLPLDMLSAGVGRVSLLSTFITPFYLIVVFAGWRKTVRLLAAITAISVAFTGVHFYMSNFKGPYLADILAALAAMLVFAVLVRFWKPADHFATAEMEKASHRVHTGGAILKAWTPYLLLVVCVLVWGYQPIHQWLDQATLQLKVPWLDHGVRLMPPVVAQPRPLEVVFKFDWLAAAGTATFIAALLGGLAIGMRPQAMARAFAATLRQLAVPALTVASVLAFAFLMNYSGMTATLGLAFAATGWCFPFFSAFLGWVGVFVTGSDTSANALFGNLQVVTAQKLGLNPLLTAAVNSAAGAMGKMISLQSIAVAIAATGLPQSDESRLFRWTLKHSLLLTALIGLIAMVLAHLAPGLMP